MTINDEMFKSEDRNDVYKNVEKTMLEIKNSFSTWKSEEKTSNYSFIHFYFRY